MRSHSEYLDRQIRGEKILFPRNRVTVKRKNLGRKIIAKANGNPQLEYQESMDILGDNHTRLQEYVIQHSEEPAPDMKDLVKQVTFLRRQEAKDASNIYDFNGEESRIFLEQQEDMFEEDNGYKLDSFLGDLGAPLDIANTHIESGAVADGFAATGLIGGLVNMIGGKINDAELKRAAQGKSANVITGISTGGKAHYNALVAYFKAHPDIKQKVLNGEITDEGQLPNWTPPNQGTYGNDDVRASVAQFADPYVNDQVKRFLPYIIGGAVLLLIIIIVIVSRSKK